jgi:hypothetical protein
MIKEKLMKIKGKKKRELVQNSSMSMHHVVKV